MRAMFAALLLFCVITPAAAQEPPIMPPILWYADQPDTGEYPLYGDFQIYTWDGAQAVNVSRYRGYCDGIYPFSETTVLFRCQGDMFAWDGQRTRLITNERSLFRPAISADGRLAAWAYSADAEYAFEIAVWDGGDVEYVSSPYGWVGGPYWTSDGGEDAPRWSPDGERLAWFSSQDGGETFGVYVWDGEQVISVADGLAWVYHLTWTSAGSLFWSAGGDNPLDRIRSLWDGQQNVRLGDFDETAIIGSEILGTGNQIAWILTTDSGSEIAVFDGSDTRIVSEPSAEPVFALTWLSDGRLMWITDVSGEGRLYLWNGTTTDHILPNIGRAFRIERSPNGEQLLIKTQRDGRYEFYVWDTEQLIDLTFGLGEGQSAYWTPFGGIAIHAGTMPDVSLWLWDDGETRLISDDIGIVDGSIWLASETVVFQTYPEGTPQIFLWEDGEQTLLLERMNLVSVQQRGDLLFIQADGNIYPYGYEAASSEIFLWDGASIVNISQSATYDGFYDPFGMG